jgi:hypothetical protein
MRRYRLASFGMLARFQLHGGPASNGKDRGTKKHRQSAEPSRTAKIPAYKLTFEMGRSFH